MELPKNITQVGETDRYCRVYVEDYVISHIKQLNRQAQDKEMAVALYGNCREEEGVSYWFCYGAVRLFSLQKEVRHLSQAQNQEIEKNRKLYFPEHSFLGYRILNGEMVEGFHICEKGVCRYIAGYACFYEKNDAMLAYMLNSRKEEAEPESVDLEKYEKVKKRQEERRMQAEQETQTAVRRKEYRRPGVSENRIRKLKTTAAAGFLTICALGIAGVSYLGDREAIETAATKLIASFTQETGKINEQPIESMPAEKEGEKKEEVTKDVLVTEDKLTEVLQKENAASVGVQIPENKVEEQPSEFLPSIAPILEPQKPDPIPDAAQTFSSYTIRRGDTLTEISMRIYGTDRRVQDICELNGIDNPDDIRFGQKILLP